jgi:nitrogen fixation/metabolism regulation signal transduction histidine kinase
LDALAAAHAELSRRQSFTDALLETVEVGIVSCDADGVLVVSNRAERAMFGLQSGLEGPAAGAVRPAYRRPRARR